VLNKELYNTNGNNNNNNNCKKRKNRWSFESGKSMQVEKEITTVLNRE